MKTFLELARPLTSANVCLSGHRARAHPASSAPIKLLFPTHLINHRIIGISVVHEPSGLEPFEPGGASSRLEQGSTSRLESLAIYCWLFWMIMVVCTRVWAKVRRTSSMVLTTSVNEIKPSGDVSFLGVQPFRVHDSYREIASWVLLLFHRRVERKIKKSVTGLGVR